MEWSKCKQDLTRIIRESINSLDSECKTVYTTEITDELISCVIASTSVEEYIDALGSALGLSAQLKVRANFWYMRARMNKKNMANDEALLMYITKSIFTYYAKKCLYDFDDFDYVFRQK